MTNVRPGTPFLDCGVWQGDGKSLELQRPFGIACDRWVLLCEFGGTSPLTFPAELDAGILERIRPALLTLAGPMRLDVTIREMLRMAQPVSRDVLVFLPELHLPLIPQLPDVDPNLVPDPNNATCACHGPVITRMLYGAPESRARYRAVSAPISRNPNDWFVWLADTHRAVADDLIKFLDRLGKLNGNDAPHLVQLGDACAFWQGYRCVVQTMGRAAFVKPTVIDCQSLESVAAEWFQKTIRSKCRDAIERLLQWQRRGATVLNATTNPHWLHSSDVLAEVRSSVVEREAPSAFLALREQKVRLIPPNSLCPPECLLPYLAAVHERTTALGAGLYVTAGAPKAFLSTIDMFA